MSDPDLWDEVLSGAVTHVVAVPEEAAPVAEVEPEPEPEPEPESEPEPAESQEESPESASLPAAGEQPGEPGAVEPENDLCSWCDSTHQDPDAPELACAMCRPEQRPDVPRLLDNYSDISGMTDEQLEACFALRPPSWLQEGAELEATAENIKLLGTAFVGRRNPVPIRKPGGDWHAEHRDLTREDFEKHLRGEHLLGAYLLDENNTTGVAVCDIDAEGELKAGLLAGRYWPRLDLAWWARVVGDALSLAMASGVHVTLTGGKGAHAVCVLPERASAAIVRRQLHWMCVGMGLKRSGLQWAHPSGQFFVECFPKQDEAGKGLGNLIRLPNGQDPTTRQKCLVLNDHPDTVIEERAVQAMYRVDPVGDEQMLRREIQETLERQPTLLGWMSTLLGDKYQVSFQRRCEALATGGPQMRNAVGQAIHMACIHDTVIASGLITELELTKGFSVGDD